MKATQSMPHAAAVRAVGLSEEIWTKCVMAVRRFYAMRSGKSMILRKARSESVEKWGAVECSAGRVHPIQVDRNDADIEADRLAGHLNRRRDAVELAPAALENSRLPQGDGVLRERHVGDA